MHYDQDTSLFATIARINRLFARSLTSRLAPHDVRPGYLSILHLLWQKDGVTQKVLRSHLDIEQATLSNTLKRMERDSLITRTPNPKDRRHQLIHLTEKGHGTRAVVKEAVDDLSGTVNTGLTINDRRYFNRILKQMAEQLENDSAEPLFVLMDEVTD